MISNRFLTWRNALKKTLASFHRKFWTWLYIEAGKRLSSLDVAEYWDEHWQRIVAYRLHQTEERYGKEFVKYLLSPTDGLTHHRDHHDVVRDIRADR